MTSTTTVGFRVKFALLACLLLIAAVATIIDFRAEPEPVVGGKTITAWGLTLGDFGPSKEGVLQEEIARRTLDSLGAKTTVPYLLGILENNDTPFQHAWRATYLRLPGPFKQLIPPPKRPSPIKERFLVAEYLGSLARNASFDLRPAAPRLARLLEHPDEWVRLPAADALLGFGTNATASVAPIQRLLEKEPQNVSQAMFNVLENCGMAAQSTIPALQNNLANTNELTRFYSAHALWTLDKSQWHLAKPIIVHSLKITDIEIQIEAARVLWRMDPNSIDFVRFLLRIIQDPLHRDKDEIIHAIQLLAEMGPAARAAIPTLEVSLQGAWNGPQDEIVRTAAKEAIEKLRARP